MSDDDEVLGCVVGFLVTLGLLGIIAMTVIAFVVVLR